MADSLVYTWEKTNRESGDKLSEDIKKEIQEKVDELKKVKDGDNIEEIKTKTNEASQVIQKAGAELYKEAPKEEPKPPTEGEAKEEKEEPKE